MVSGAAGSRRGDGTNAWDVQDAGCRTRSFSVQSKELSQQSSCASSESYRPCCVHVDNRGITDGLCGGEMKCTWAQEQRTPICGI